MRAVVYALGVLLSMMPTTLAQPGNQNGLEHRVSALEEMPNAKPWSVGPVTLTRRTDKHLATAFKSEVLNEMKAADAETRYKVMEDKLSAICDEIGKQA